MVQVDQTIDTPEVSARRPWASAAAAAGFALMIGTAVLATSLSREAGGEGDWLANLQDVIADFYDTGDIQILAAMCAVGLLLEWLIPARRQAMSNGWLNIPYSVLILVFIGAIVPFQFMIADMSISWIGWRNIINLRFDAGGSIVFGIVAMVAGAAVIDFFFYWFHRCQHKIPALWQVHMLHHTDRTLNVTTTHRVHFVEHLLTPFFMIAPVMILFDMPDREIFWIAVAPSIWSYAVHANVRIGFGRFWWLLSSPQYHRIHHSILPEHRDRNFAVWFPLYDIAFGTAFAPRPNEYPPSGVEDQEVTTLGGAFALPFARWWRMLRHRLRQG